MAAVVVAGTACRAHGMQFGPNSNPDDQFRFMWGMVPQVHDMLVADGFNTFVVERIVSFGRVVRWFNPTNMTMNAGGEVDLAFKAEIDRCHRDGISWIERFNFAHDKYYLDRFPRIRKDGTASSANVDAANPVFIDEVRRGVEMWARALDNHPAIVGVHTESEVRDRSFPSFTADMRAAYRRDSGRDVPPEAEGRNPPSWRDIPGFPSDRIIPSDYPLLEFYRWFWKKGDGWNDYQTLIAETAQAQFRRPILTMYDPALRTPPISGSGGRVTHLNHWTYASPDPYSVAYNIAELQSRVRKTGQRVLAMVQAIAPRSLIAPIGIHPAGEPAWTGEFPTTRYPTMPHGMMREALWAAFSRKTDGIGIHGWNAIHDGAVYGIPHACPTYQCTDPRTAEVISNLFHGVAGPLGPLLKKVPERQPEVAILENATALMFSRGGATWSCEGAFFDCGIVATAASLSPWAVTEDEFVEDGLPGSVKVLLLPGCEVLTRPALERVDEFRRRGGIVLADTSVAPAVKHDASLPTIMKAYRELDGDHDRTVGYRHAQDPVARRTSIRNAAAELTGLVSGKVLPYGKSDNPDILVHVRSFGAADYVFAINDRRRFGEYVGAWRRVLDDGSPCSGRVTVRRTAGAVYDLVRHEAVPFAVKDGTTSLAVEFSTNDGRMLLVAPRPLRALCVRRVGGKVEVVSPDRDVLVPIAVSPEAAGTRYGVLEDGRWMRDFPGRCVSVKSLATGETFCLKRQKDDDRAYGR